MRNIGEMKALLPEDEFYKRRIQASVQMIESINESEDDEKELKLPYATLISDIEQLNHITQHS